MKNKFTRTNLIFTATFLLFVVLIVQIYVLGLREIYKSEDWVSHTNRTITLATELDGLTSSITALQIIYILTGVEEFKSEYFEKKRVAIDKIGELNKLIKDNPSQIIRLKELSYNFTKHTQNLESGFPNIDNLITQEKLNSALASKAFRAKLYTLNKILTDEEYRLQNIRIKYVSDLKDKNLSYLIIVGSLSIILLLVLNSYLLHTHSKRKDAENALSEKEEIYRIAIEGTQDGVYDWNIKTGIVSYTEQFSTMIGFNKDDFEGRVDEFWNRMHPDDIGATRLYTNSYIDGKIPEFSVTFRMQHKDGHWVWIHSRGKLLRDDKGNPLRLIGAHMNISLDKEYELKLKEEKEKAEKANIAKSEFLEHMSHEIRTPLTTIGGVAEIFEMNKEDFDESKKELIKALYKSSLSLKDIIIHILDFSKIESGKMEIAPKIFSLQDTFEHVISVMSSRAIEKKLSFTFDFEKLRGKFMYADEIRFRQILINLIGNAIKFTDIGRVHVKVSEHYQDQKKYLQIMVSDTGIGIKPNQFELIFERFTQGDSSETRRFGGTGLGLSIVRKLANLMGGSVAVKSIFGKGSAFTLTLPFNQVDEKYVIATRDSNDLYNDNIKSIVSNKKILVVEDYEGNIALLGHILNTLGVGFDFARNGIQALQLWQENHYDSILMDVQMPEMDGFTATKNIRRIESEQNLKRIPIIGLTAHALVSDETKCIEAGMDDYLAKPIHIKDLTSTLIKFLSINQDDA